VVSVTDLYGRIVGFLDRSRYFFFGSAGNRTRASGSVAKNSDHWTTEADVK
jgi:hypothetical protein